MLMLLPPPSGMLMLLPPPSGMLLPPPSGMLMLHNVCPPPPPPPPPLTTSTLGLPGGRGAGGVGGGGGQLPCSATCGVGLKTQQLCLRNQAGDGQKWTACRVRRVKCVEAWRCGLRTLTVLEGTRLEINCLGDVMQAMGPYSWR
ncbi:hypothetical protein NHX12_013091 [Muraenolepis orangiensis]|uniref:Transmembrane protein 81 n=1 Tax=Muraenolepis orangiensis TaxID=630683 RepID=A0A9Q0DDQ4_9TELE|nr:hypothetical protein NHX12_013091 [Muraenolepis orangiensis]